MIFKPFYSFETGCAAYVSGCGSVGKGAVVDPPARDVEACSSSARWGGPDSPGHERENAATLHRRLHEKLLSPPKPEGMQEILRLDQGRL